MAKVTIKDIKAAMEALGTYKAEYDPLIKVYCDLWEQYDVVQKRMKSTSYASSVDGARGNPKQSYDVKQHEALRKDILAYSDRLKLNPKAMMDTPTASSGSALEKALLSLEK